MNFVESTISTDVNFSYIDYIYDSVLGKTVERWTALLPGSGCEWAKKTHKGCRFCAFHHKIKEVTEGKLLAYEEMMGFFALAQKRVNGHSPELLALFNGGNYINGREIVAQAQMDILKEASYYSTLKTILFETRIEYLSKKNLEACLKAIGNKKLRVAIGLETKDDYLRNKVINKGLSKEAYERAVRRLHSLGIEVQSYIFMKPMTISEKRAIQEAVDSINYAVACGSEIVMLESAMVQENTAFYDAYVKGEFKPPWLWSIREVVAKTCHLPSLNVGIFDEVPHPIAGPKNCEQCTPDFLKGFQIFRETHAFAPLTKLDCSCRKIWQSEIVNS